MSLTAMFARRLVVAASVVPRRAMPAVLRATLATKSNSINLPDNEKIKPASENPEGPMMGGYQEFVDDVIAKTEKMEESMDALKDTYDKKRQAVLTTQTVKWMDPNEIEALFDIAGTQKRELEEQLRDMKAQMEAAKSNFAVDAPDGESDGHLEEEMEEVTHMIDDSMLMAKTQEMEESMEALKKTYDKKKAAILESQTVKWMDAKEIEALFDMAGTQKREMEEQLQAMKATIEAAKTNFAVDAPDGESDGHLEEEMEEVTHIIDDAAADAKKKKAA